MPIPKRLLILFGLLFAALPSQAQPPSTLPATAADVAWQRLKTFGRPGASGANHGQSRAQQAAASLAQADQLKAFYITYPTHPAAKEAKQREVVALALAAIHGDFAQDARREQALAAVRIDPGLSVGQRCEAVGWSERVALKRQNLSSGPAVLAAEESLTRRLIQEFPSHAGGYNSLLGIARASSPERGEVIARDILSMRGASSQNKADAQRLLDRYALVGSPIAPLLEKAGATSLMPAANAKVSVFYTWNTSAPQSLSLASHLAAKAPTARFIGVCLDTNLATAQQLAATKNPPGEQYYNANGPASLLADGLATRDPLTVYLVDREGIIRDVKGATDFAAKLA